MKRTFETIMVECMKENPGWDIIRCWNMDTQTMQWMCRKKDTPKWFTFKKLQDMKRYLTKNIKWPMPLIYDELYKDKE